MSIDVNVQNDLVIVTESSEDITVNVSNAAGPAGANGVGVPVGGTTGQVLKKLSNTNYDTYWALDGGGVPYSGATGDVNLGEFQLRAGQLTLDTSPTGTAAVGTTRWNDTIGSSETTLKGGSVILKNGVDLVARVVNKVSPNTTLTKAAYQAVRVSGAQGQRLAVAFAQANNDANSADTIGLVCETIATNQEGFIITVGQLENINTTGSLQGETWADGDVLYLSPTTPGAITKVKPTGNGHIVVIGYVEYAHANNGKIYVKVMNGWELDELHDVDIVTPANNEALIYESSTQLWKNKTIATALGYTPISGTGVSGQVAYWNGTNSQTGSANFVWDNATGRLSILSGVDNLLNLTPSSSGNAIVVNSNGYIKWENASLDTYIRGSNGFFILNNGFNTQVAFPFGTMSYINTGQNFAIGGSTDGGQRLQVYGTSLFTGYALFGSGNTGTPLATLADFRGGSDVDFIQVARASTSSDRYVRMYANGQIDALSTKTDSAPFTFAAAANANTSGTRGLFSLTNTFNPTSGTATYTTFQINQTINQTGGANGITRGLYVNPTLTAAADWRSIEWSNNSGWGLYGAGTANNYLNGNLWVGSTSATGYKLASVGATLLNGLVVFGTYGTGVGMYWDNANNSFGIGNTSPSAKIDVLGINLVNVKVKSNTNSGATIYQAANDLNNTNEFGMWGSTRGAFGAINSGDGFVYSNVSLAITSGVDIKFGTGATPTEKMRLTAAGRLLLGTTTEGTFLLDVNGTARVSGQLNTSDLLSNGNNVFRIQNTALGLPSGSAGVGTEIFTFGAGVNIESYDRTGGAYTALRLRGATVQVTGATTFINSATNTSGGFVHSSTSSTNDAFYTLLSSQIRFYVNANGYCKSTSNIVSDANGATTLNASAIAQIDSTNKGFLPPRMTTTQKNAIGTPAAGLQVYDTTLNQMSYYNGTTWVNF